MMNFISGQITASEFMTGLIVIIVVFYFVYKEWPDFKRRMTQNTQKDEENKYTDKDLERRMTVAEKRLDEHQEMFARDYKRLNALEDSVELNRRISVQTLEEMEIIMRAMLGVLRALQEMGANGATKEAQEEINGYLTKIAHRRDIAREIPKEVA